MEYWDHYTASETMASTPDLHRKHQMGLKRPSLGKHGSGWFLNLHLVTKARKKCDEYQRPWLSRNRLQMEPSWPVTRYSKPKWSRFHNISKQGLNGESIQHSKISSRVCSHPQTWLSNHLSWPVPGQPVTGSGRLKLRDLHMVHQRIKDDKMLWKTSKWPNSGCKHGGRYCYRDNWHQLVLWWYTCGCWIWKNTCDARHEKNLVSIGRNSPSRK